MTILCVDDHPIIAKGLQNSVTKIYPEATVRAFTGARDALSYAQLHGCDILLCEIELYNHGGLALAQQIRNLNPQVHIVFVTVCSEQEHAEALLQLRPSGFLTKPTTDSLLVAQLQQLRRPVVC